jgi:hypothetical protein
MMKTRILIGVIFLSFIHSIALGNPYLPKPGERSLSMRISTCAVSGGFVHLYTALDNGLFDKYGMKLENVFIRGSGPNLSALSGDEVVEPDVCVTALQLLVDDDVVGLTILCKVLVGVVDYVFRAE